jgi:hypothetical protein
MPEQKVIDKCYPEVEIQTRAHVVETVDGYQFQMHIHVLGPDEIDEHQGTLFPSRKQATEEMLGEYVDVFKKLTRSLLDE